MDLVTKYFYYFFKFQGIISIKGFGGKLEVSHFPRFLFLATYISLRVYTIFFNYTLVFSDKVENDLFKFTQEDFKKVSSTFMLVSGVLNFFNLFTLMVVAIANFRNQERILLFIEVCQKVKRKFKIDKMDVSSRIRILLIVYAICQILLIINYVSGYRTLMKISFKAFFFYVLSTWGNHMSFFLMMVAIIFVEFVRMILEKANLKQKVEAKLLILKVLTKLFESGFHSQLSISYCHLLCHTVFTVRFCFSTFKIELILLTLQPFLSSYI